MKVVKTMLRAFLFGIGVGILLAPRAGSETRRLLSEKVNQLIDSASSLTGSSASGPTDATTTAYVPPQHYTESSSMQEVGSAGKLSM